MSPGGRAAERRVLRAVLAAIPLTAALQFALSGPAVGREELVRRGAELYATSCASCHGPGGEGTADGPPLIGVGAAAVDFMLATGRMPLADPDAQPVRQAPAFDRSGIEALVAFVGTLGPGGAPIPSVDPGAGDLGLGRAVYASSCMACHGAGATGDALVGGAVAPALDRATALQIAEAVRIGPGQMPPFGPDEIDQRQLDSLARYVTYLRGAPDPGGAALGRVGPVAEGFVGWFVGLGALLVVIRLTGTRR
ncbi:MAG TPA: c-type cytochrome [Actinomycetota bacterium]|nr:c-type cytochrome [Actinomycetota bacterium]